MDEKAAIYAGSFDPLWARIGARGDARAEFDDLCRRYGEAHRAYHTLAHVEHCLREFEALRDVAPHPDAVELALCYHDAVYDTRATDSEERSAWLVVDLGRQAGIEAGLVERSVALILASKHLAPPTDPDARAFVDADLAILGQPWDRFSEYEQQVRREYGWVPAWLFRRKRSALLKTLLARPALFSTEILRRKYEFQARANLRRSLGLSR
jgi:predicted metal-dependent HD superfamily phosphohydrolase